MEVTTEPRLKRLRLVADTGNEEFAETDLWKRLGATEEAFCQRQRDKTQPTVEIEHEQGEGEEEDTSVATPLEVIESLGAARGELQLVLDLIGLLIDRYDQEVAVEYIPDTRNPLLRLSQLTEDFALRCGHKQNTLSATGANLRAGVKALRDRCRRENAFYYELAKLQSYWKVHHNPSNSETDFSFDLSLGRVAEQLFALAPAHVMVDVLKDAQGHLKISVESVYRTGWKSRRPRNGVEETGRNGIPTKVAIGGRAVHVELLRQQQEMVWWLLEETLHRQGEKNKSHSNYLCTLTHKLLARTATTQVPSLAAFEPFLLQHFLTHLFQTPMTPSMVGVPDGERLLTEVVHWLGHALWGRRNAWRQVDQHVADADDVTLHWQPSWHPCLSVLRICIGGSFSGLLMVRGMGLELEGRGQCSDGSTKYFAMQTSHKEISRLMQALVSKQMDNDCVVDISSSIGGEL